MELTPDDVRDVLRVLDSSGLDELHLELADLSAHRAARGARPGGRLSSRSLAFAGAGVGLRA